MSNEIKKYFSHGNGSFKEDDFLEIGENIIFEEGVKVFHPENIVLESNIYVGHYAILKGYYKNEMHIKRNSWVGQNCFFHSAGGIEIGEAVGVGPCVIIITSSHTDLDTTIPIISQPLSFGKVIIGDNCDIGTGSVILPGVTIGQGSIIGAGSVVTNSVPDFSVAVGAPARVIRKR